MDPGSIDDLDIHAIIAEDDLGNHYPPPGTLQEFGSLVFQRLTAVWGDESLWFPMQYRPARYQPSQVHMVSLWAVTCLTRKYGEDLGALWNPRGLLWSLCAMFWSVDQTPTFGTEAAEWILKAVVTADRAGHRPSAIISHLSRVGRPDGALADALHGVSDIPKHRDAAVEIPTAGPGSPAAPSDRVLQMRETQVVDPEVLGNDVLQQLQDVNTMLADNVVDFVARLLTLDVPQMDNVRIMHPLWMRVSPNRSAQPLNRFSPALVIPLHWDTALHWTLATAQFHDNGTVNFTHYDSMGGNDRGTRAHAFFERWLAETNYGGRQWDVILDIPACPRQNDATSCGVFVVSYIDRLLHGQQLPLTFDGAKERLAFLERIVQMRNTPPVSTLSNWEGRALNHIIGTVRAESGSEASGSASDFRHLFGGGASGV